MGWLSGWTNQAALTISANNTSNLTNYQIKVQVQGYNPAGAYYVDWTKLKTDGSDFRFTDSDGTTLIDYWRAFINNDSRTAVLVAEVPSILANTTKTIYLYYGNAAATDVSSFTNTMAKRQVNSTDLAVLLCDGGSGTTLTDSTSNANNFTLSSASAWATGELGVSPLAYSSYLSFQSAYNAQAASLLNTPPASGYIEFKVKWASTNGFTNSERLFSKITNETTSNLLDCYMNTSDHKMYVRKINGGSTITLTSTTASWTGGTEYTIRISWGAGGFTLSVNGSVQATNADTNAWGSGSLRSFILGAANSNGLIANKSSAFMRDIKVYDSTNSVFLAYWHTLEYNGTIAHDALQAYDLTLSSQNIWVPFASANTSDNDFTSGNCVNFAGTYYATKTGLLDTPPENFEFSCVLRPNALINSGTAAQVIFSKFNVSAKVLNCASAYYGQATGKTLLDTMPATGYVEMGVYPTNFTSAYYLFQKVNVEGASRDSLSIYLDTGGHINVQVYKGGAIQTLTGTTALTLNAFNRIRCHFGAYGMAIFINSTLDTSDVSKSNLPGTGTARAAIIGAQNYGGAIANIFSGKICSVKVYDLNASSTLAYYPNTEGTGTTLNDQSGNTQTITLSSASIWDASATTTEGLRAYFLNGVGTIRWQRWKCGAMEYVDTVQASWASGTDYYLRFCLGWEGMFIYVNEDCIVNGNFNQLVRTGPNAGSNDAFAIGAQVLNGAAANYLNCKVDSVAISSIHSSKRKGGAYFERRQITADPFTRYGAAISNAMMPSANSYSEPRVVDYGSGNLGMVCSEYPWPTGGNVMYATSADGGRSWTNYAGNPIISNYRRPSILTDETGAVMKQAGNYWVYTCDSGQTSFRLFSFPSFTSAYTDLGTVLSLRGTNSISSATGNGTITTVTTVAASHGYVVGEKVGIDQTSTALDLTMNATQYTILSVPAANQFTVASAYSGTVATGRVSSWDSVYLGNCKPFYDNSLGLFVMMYDATGYQNTWWAGRATSADGITWTRDVQNSPYPGPSNGLASAPYVAKRNGVYYALDHEYPPSTLNSSDMGYLTSPDTQVWTRDLTKSPFVQRNVYANSDQVADGFLVDRTGVPETLLYMTEIPYQPTTSRAIETVGLWIAAGLTAAQALNPDPTIGLTWATNTGRIVAGDLNGLGGMGVMRMFQPLQ